MSGPDEGVWFGVPAVPSDGAVHTTGTLTAVENTLAGVVKPALKN